MWAVITLSFYKNHDDVVRAWRYLFFHYNKWLLPLFALKQNLTNIFSTKRKLKNEPKESSKEIKKEIFMTFQTVCSLTIYVVRKVSSHSDVPSNFRKLFWNLYLDSEGTPVFRMACFGPPTVFTGPRFSGFPSVSSVVEPFEEETIWRQGATWKMSRRVFFFVKIQEFCRSEIYKLLEKWKYVVDNNSADVH